MINEYTPFDLFGTLHNLVSRLAAELYSPIGTLTRDCLCHISDEGKYRLHSDIAWLEMDRQVSLIYRNISID